MKKFKQFIFAFLLLSILPLNTAFAQENQENGVPVILEVLQNTTLSAKQPVITGLTPSNSEVLIYVDGSFVGVAEINREGGTTDNFYFSVPKDLSSGGHSARAIAKDRTSLRLSEFSNQVNFTVTDLPAPTLIQPNEETITQKVKPLIVGLTKSNTKIKIFIDGRLNGETVFVSHQSGTADFAYTPFLNLSVGWHTAWAIAVDQSGRESKASNVLHFNIEEKFPAPTMLAPDKDLVTLKPTFYGLAKNDSRIKVFVDHKLAKEFMVKNNDSGTANFYFTPDSPLSPGQHIIYATASDQRGKESIWSNIIYYTALPPVYPPAISQEAESEELAEEINNLLEISRSNPEQILSRSDLLLLNNILSNPEEFILSSQDRQSLENLLAGQEIAPDGKTSTEEEPEKPGSGEQAEEGSGTSTTLPGDLEEILSGTGTVSEQAGLLDETQNQQNKVKLNLIIFFLFLIAVIVWIFWVNRELIKERNQADKADQEKSKK